MEALWRDYNSFEQGVNKLLAEKLIHDKTRDHMIARKVAKVFRLHLRLTAQIYDMGIRYLQE